MQKWIKKTVKRAPYYELSYKNKDNYENIVPLNELENNEQWINNVYRAPSRRLFTLADFVVDTTLTSVTSHRNKLSEYAKEDFEVKNSIFLI